MASIGITWPGSGAAAPAATLRRAAGTVAAIAGAAFCASSTTEIDVAGVLRTAEAQARAQDRPRRP